MSLPPLPDLWASSPPLDLTDQEEGWFDGVGLSVEVRRSLLGLAPLTEGREPSFSSSLPSQYQTPKPSTPSPIARNNRMYLT